LLAIDSASGSSTASLVLDLAADKKGDSGRRTALAQLDFATPQATGHLQATAEPPLSDLRGLDFNALSRNEFTVDARMSSQRGST
ncbi:hypothetical protein ABTK37_20475, partial [Acinetobacter baumannii]